MKKRFATVAGPKAIEPTIARVMKIRNKVRIAASLCAAIILLTLGRPQGAYSNTTLLPNAEQCFSATTGLTGFIGLLGTITGGTLYTAGTYPNVALTGGSGSGATANITVSGGAVTAVTIVNPGIQYAAGDSLSAAAANIGGTGSGFAVGVSSIAINSSLAGGTVAMFIPGTTTAKQTWKDANQVTLNSNPITLDANGCAIIYGVGSYRQQLFDSLGNLIWDQLTTDTSASNSVFWAGLAGGTPNAITVSDAGFNNTDGAIINFTALNANTGSATLNPGSGAIPILKDTSSGPISLSGGEIQPNNIVSVEFKLADSSFHILNLIPTSSSASQAPLCGATNLKVFNDAISPNSTMDITADQALMQTSGGAFITRNSISVTVNLTISGTAGGLDSRDTFSPSIWYNVFLIDNGVAPKGFASNTTHGNAPSLPSGYTYFCRMGSIFTNPSNNLARTRQNGNTAQYVISTSETTTLRAISLGTIGTYHASSTPTWASLTVQNTFVPPTATAIALVVDNGWNGLTRATMAVAPNSNYGGIYTPTPPPFVIDDNSGGQPYFISNPVWMNLESASISAAVNGAGGGILAWGWRDSVNAN